MKSLLLAAAALCLFPLAAHAAPVIGQPAPAFTGTDSTGATRSLADYKGKTVVLEWTNPECPYVKKFYGSNAMQAQQKAVTDSGVIWLSINSSAEGKQGYLTQADATKLLTDEKASPTALILDHDGVIGTAYEAKTTPHMFVIDPAGTLVYAGAIDDNPSSDPKTLETAKNYVAQTLGELTAGKPVSEPLTQSYGCGVKY